MVGSTKLLGGGGRRAEAEGAHLHTAPGRLAGHGVGPPLDQLGQAEQHEHEQSCAQQIFLQHTHSFLDARSPGPRDCPPGSSHAGSTLSFRPPPGECAKGEEVFRHAARTSSAPSRGSGVEGAPSRPRGNPFVRRALRGSSGSLRHSGSSSIRPFTSRAGPRPRSSQGLGGAQS
jgi:hypothetical protein